MIHMIQEHEPNKSRGAKKSPTCLRSQIVQKILDDDDDDDDDLVVQNATNKN